MTTFAIGSKNRIYSKVVFLPYPSAILLGTDIAAFLICDVMLYISSFGNLLLFYRHLNTTDKTFAKP